MSKKIILLSTLLSISSVKSTDYASDAKQVCPITHLALNLLQENETQRSTMEVQKSEIENLTKENKLLVRENVFLNFQSKRDDKEIDDLEHDLQKAQNLIEKFVSIGVLKEKLEDINNLISNKYEEISKYKSYNTNVFTKS